MLALTAACIVAVLVAVLDADRARVGSDHAGLRAPATALAVITPIGLVDLHARRAARSTAGRAAPGPRRRCSARRPLGGRAGAVAAAPVVGSAVARRGLAVRSRRSLDRDACTQTPGAAAARSSTCASTVQRPGHGRLRVRLGGPAARRRRPVDDRQPGRPRGGRAAVGAPGPDRLRCAATEFIARVGRQPGIGARPPRRLQIDTQTQHGHRHAVRVARRSADERSANGGHHGLPRLLAGLEPGGAR